MRILASVGRFLTAIAAILFVLGGVGAGGFLADHAGGNIVVGAIAGGIAGLILAGSLFGAIAALFEIADNTGKTVRLLERLEARAQRGV